MKNYDDVLNFWFEKLDRKQWYRKSDALDAEIKRLFERTLQAIVAVR